MCTLCSTCETSQVECGHPGNFFVLVSQSVQEVVRSQRSSRTQCPVIVLGLSRLSFTTLIPRSIVKASGQSVLFHSSLNGGSCPWCLSMCLWWDSHGVRILSFLVGHTWSPDFVKSSSAVESTVREGFGASCHVYG